MMTWTAYVQQDGDDLILPLPEEVLAEMKWKEGDILVWEIQENGSVTLRKKPAWYDILWSRIRQLGRK